MTRTEDFYVRIADIRLHTAPFAANFMINIPARLMLRTKYARAWTRVWYDYPAPTLTRGESAFGFSQRHLICRYYGSFHKKFRDPFHIRFAFFFSAFCFRQLVKNTDGRIKKCEIEFRILSCALDQNLVAPWPRNFQKTRFESLLRLDLARSRYLKCFFSMK